MSVTARVGDNVLARGKVTAVHGSHAVAVFGAQSVPLDRLDIVSVEQEFRVGDWAQDKTGSDYGQITAIVDGHAWVKQVGKDRPTTRDLRSISRMDRK